MGRKQNRTVIWNVFKQDKRKIRDRGGKTIDNTNVLMIDPAEQKQRKLLRRLAKKVQQPKQPSKEEIRKLQKLQEKKAKEAQLKIVLSELEPHQLSNDQLSLLVATKHKETKKERLKRLYLSHKAGILDATDSELFTVTPTPSRVLDMKHEMDVDDDDNQPSQTPTEFDFGTLSSTHGINGLIPGALDKAYQMDGVQVVSTRTMRQRKQNAVVLMDITETETETDAQHAQEEEEEEEDGDNDERTCASDIVVEPSTATADGPVHHDQKKQKRTIFGGLPAKSSIELQSFLECGPGNDALVLHEQQRRRKFTVQINRLPHIVAQRSQLPIINEEFRIMECIREHDVVLIAGETGSGKSTQVPQFLYEAGYSWRESQRELEQNGGHGGYGMIGVTEPRRVAAMSVCSRVAVELNTRAHVHYQIRYDSQVTDDTRIKFMTDGILLREIQSDFLLNKYCVIILDEAHERNLNTDVLIGLLSKIVRQRRRLFAAYLVDVQHNKKTPRKQLCPLKLIVMSATLKVEDFTENSKLFHPPPPLIQIPARQYPVTIHFNKETPLLEQEYEEELFKKICKIHVLLPKGHILVFLTGRRQIEYICTRLRQRFHRPTATSLPVVETQVKKPHRQNRKQKSSQTAENAGENVGQNGEFKVENGRKMFENGEQNGDEKDENELCVEDLIMMKAGDPDDEDGDNDGDMDGGETPQNAKMLQLLTNWEYNAYAPVAVLPLYSLLDPERQKLVFGRVASNTRLIVVATNIAETSITIPGIRYVIDCGRVKQQKYFAKENMTKMVVEFVSKSSALQRAGRAGRTGPGHCYRLYSSTFYDQWMSDHFAPEILRVPIEHIILQMKAMNIAQISNFPFPTPPQQQDILYGLRILETLGALTYKDEYSSSSSSGSSNGYTNKTLLLLRDNQCLMSDEHQLQITDLGRSMLEYPIAVRCAKMLILGSQGNCLPFVMAICALLSVESLQFMPDEIEKMLTDKMQPNPPPKSSSSSNKQQLLQLESSNDKKQRIQRKQKRKLVLSARHQFADNKSDILSWLNIFGAYQCYRKEIEKRNFCQEYFIRHKNISECHSLLMQLQQIMHRVHEQDDDDDDLDETQQQQLKLKLKLEQQPPSNVQQILLRQIIASGLVDQIARRWPEGQIPDDDDWHKSRQNFLVLRKAYQCLSCPEAPVFIHPSSYIFSRALVNTRDDEIDEHAHDTSVRPQFVVYYALHKSETMGAHVHKRTYMRCVTVIEPHWLLTIAPHLCITSEPLTTPSPYYDEVADCVKCYVEVRFGPFQWQMPMQKVAIQKEKLRYQWFARLLISGAIFKDMKQIQPYLQHRPNSITDHKYAAITNEAIVRIVDTLQTHQIDSKQALRIMVNSKPDFLLAELKLWIYHSKHYMIKKIWPPNFRAH